MSAPYDVLRAPARFVTQPPQGVVPNSFVGIPNRGATNPVANLGPDHAPAFLDARTATPGLKTNASYKHAYLMNKRDWAPHHTGGKMATMVSTDDTLLSDAKQTYRFHSISHFNYLLRSDVKFRNRYNQCDTQKLSNEWRFAGFQLNEDMTHSNKYVATKQAFYSMKRARVPNYWAINGSNSKPMCPLDAVYFIYMKFKEEKPLPKADSPWFWQLVPYWSPGKLNRPPSCLYTQMSSADSADWWVGSVIRVGTVFYVYYPTQWSETVFERARAGLFPTTDDGTYKQAIFDLPDIDIDLMV